MIKIYNGSKVPVEGLIQYQDLKVEEEQDQLNVISFTVPREEAALIELEGYVEAQENGRYVIKEKNYDDDERVYEIIGLYDLEELQGFVESAAYVSMTLQDMMDSLLAGTGWSLVTSDVTVRTATGVTLDRLDFIYAIVRETFGLEIKFDNQARIIYADLELGSDKGAYFSDAINLTSLHVDSDSYEFATRLIPRGKDGLSIESVNGGIPYLENLTYSSKIIEAFWSDERYTIPENLLVDGQKKLDAISKPLTSYSAKAMDLYRTHVGDFPHLEYSVGDTITLINRETETKEKQRIVKRVKYLDEPEEDTVTIANRIRSFLTESQKEFAGVKQDFTVIRATFELLDEEVKSKITRNDYDTDMAEMDLSLTEVSQKYGSIVNTIQVGGGSNIIKNSVGYGEDMNFWTLVSGAVDKGTSTWILEGIAKHGWILSAGVMYQDLDILPGKDHTISGRLIKYTEAGSILIGLYDPGTDALVHTAIEKIVTEVYDGQFSFEFNAEARRKLRLKVTTSGISAVDPVELTDLMLAQGNNLDVWSQANGEIYTVNVKMDSKGVTVYSADNKGKTVMSPEEFAGYYNDSKIFTLNGDITEVMGLDIGGKGLFIRPVKFVQTADSVDLVWAGV